ncbi:MAG: Mitochondrial beta-keto-acyl synthase [Alectoria sarmentosa]|nr:MAG: Mitochondrial beta-keto-acyl synthase [Alectoria sarmentosa]
MQIYGKWQVASLMDEYVRTKAHALQQCQVQVAGLIPRGKKEHGGWTAAEWLSGDDQRRMSTFMQYAMAASSEALDDAGWHPNTDQEQEMTVTHTSANVNEHDSAELEVRAPRSIFTKGPKKVSPFFVPQLLINLAAGHIAMKYGFKGPLHAATTACTTGAHSIGDASRFIAFGDADVMVAGASESCIHPLAFVGFERSRSLTTSFNHAPEQASRPFDAARDGFVIGEGAAVLVLESLPHALARGAHIYAEVAGYGTSSDAHHMTAPPLDGNGAFRAMRLALKNASLSPASVDYINAHATSTPLGDLAENCAIKALMLGEKGKEHAEDVNVSSTKGAVGHLLGAAGAVEALFSVLAIRDGVLPPTLNLTDLEGSEFNCNYVALEAQKRKVDVVLSNSFGFGGTNATLCFRLYRGT